MSGNDSCDQAYEMLDQGDYEAWIESDNTSDVAPACGGDGGDLFFGFTLESEQVVYLGTLDSSIDTVLGLYRSDCDGEPLRCEDDACATEGAQFVQRLEAGHYLAVVKAKQSDATGRVRLKFQHVDGTGMIVLDRAGVYGGDTSTADDSTLVCQFYGGSGDEDGGVAPGGGGMGGGTAGSMSTDGGPSSDGGVELPGPISGGKDDVYVVAKCQSSLIVSTCGTAAFDSVLEVRTSGGPTNPLACSEFYNYCQSDPDGAVAAVSGPAGLAFIVVDGRTADESGEYQMSVIY